MKKHFTSENLFGGTVEGLFTGSASPDTHFGKLLQIGKKTDMKHPRALRAVTLVGQHWNSSLVHCVFAQCVFCTAWCN